jgi:group I intron endonuclease
MTEYSKGVIYRIVNDINDDFYIGSTTTTLSRRMASHRGSLKVEKKTSRLYRMMRELGQEHFRIVLVEEYPCQNKQQLIQREEYWRTELRPTLNSYCCYTGLTMQEYLKIYNNKPENRARKNELMRERYQRPDVKEYHKNYYLCKKTASIASFEEIKEHSEPENENIIEVSIPPSTIEEQTK